MMRTPLQAIVAVAVATAGCGESSDSTGPGAGGSSAGAAGGGGTAGSGGVAGGSAGSGGVGATGGAAGAAGAALGGGAWGNPQIAASLADTEFGGSAKRVVSHCVRFPIGGNLTSVRPYIIFVEGEVGGDGYYHKGDGGTFQISLEADDGSAEHLPSGNVLAQTEHIIGIPSMYKGSGPSGATVGGDPGDNHSFRNFSFKAPTAVEAGKYYHLVFRNTTKDPSAHFVSVDDFISARSDRSLNVPTFDPTQYAVLYNDGQGWVRRVRHWAIGEYRFSDGRAFGNGYMEVGSVSGPDRVARYVDKARSVRQTFTPPTDLNVTTIAVGAMHVSGTNSMTLTLRDSSGSALATTAVSGYPTGTPSGDPRGDVSPAEAEFRSGPASSRLTLKANQQYTLEIESDGGTHTVLATRDGSLSYDFSVDSTVLGRAELRSAPGGSWQGWPLRDTSVDDEFDLSFYLEGD